MREFDITCVVGPVASGKSTYMKKRYPVNEYVHFQPGRIIRDALGVEWMKKSANPNAPEEVDFLVLSSFRSFIRLSTYFERSLICDGFPRTMAQSIAMRDILDIAGLRVRLSLVVMSPNLVEHQIMLDTRKDEFDALRLRRSCEDVEKVIIFVHNITPSERFSCRIFQAKIGIGADDTRMEQLT